MSKKKHDVVTKYDDMWFEAARQYMEAVEAKDDVVMRAARDNFKTITELRNAELDRIMRERDGKKNRVVTLVSSILNFVSSSLNTGSRIWAFHKGYTLEHVEHGIMGYSTTKESFRQISGQK